MLLTDFSRKEVRLFDRAHEDLGVLVEVVIERGCARFGSANEEEVRQPGHLSAIRDATTRSGLRQVQHFPPLWRHLTMMVLRRPRIDLFQALGIIIRPALRPAIQILAVVVMIFSLSFILFVLPGAGDEGAGSALHVFAREGMVSFHDALEKYRLDCGAYPDSRMGLQALVANPGIKRWNGSFTMRASLRATHGRGPTFTRTQEAAAGPDLLAPMENRGAICSTAIFRSDDPHAPLHESLFHAALKFFDFRIAPWLLLGSSVYALIQARSRPVRQ